MDLKSFFRQHPKAAIAFSGGADSAFLLYSAVKYGVQVKAYFAKSAFQPEFELEDAKRLAAQLGTVLEILPLDILSCDDVTENPGNRCYHCKGRIFRAIQAAAFGDGYSVLLDGSNASDNPAERPGMRVLEELSVLSPLRECGLKKADVRRLSAEAGLFTAEKPAYACLATRIPTGCRITAEKLQVTERAEVFLHALGFSDFRVRMMASGGEAKIQVHKDELSKLTAHAEIIVQELKQYYPSVLFMFFPPNPTVPMDSTVSVPEL